MFLAKSFRVKVQSIISYKFNCFRSVNVGIPINQESKPKVQDQHDWQNICNSSWDLAGISYCFSIVVENQELVNPVLDENNEKVEDVERRHTWTISKGNKNGKQDLSISYFKNKLRSSVEMFIIILNYLSCFFSIEWTFSIPASYTAKPCCLKQNENVRKDQHAWLGKNDNWSDIVVPVNVKFNIHAHKNVFKGVSFKDFIWCYKAVLSDNNEDGGVYKGHEEDISHDRDVIFSNILVSHVITNKIEDISNDNIHKSNPSSKEFSCIRFDVSNVTPVFAML